MPTGTHCLPNAVLGTAELPVPNVSPATCYIIHATTGVGKRRGVCVYLHGLGTSSTETIPAAPANVSGILPSYALMMLTQLANDGWEILCPSQQQDTYVTFPAGGFYNDVAADPSTSPGARYLASTEHLWDHIVDFIADTYASSWPIIVIGQSLGTLQTMNTLAYDNGSATPHIVAVATINNLSHLEVLSQQYVPSPVYGGITFAGLDAQATLAGAGLLNTVTIPMLLGNGTSDIAIGWTYGTIAAASNGVLASSLSGSTVSLNAPSGSAGGASNFVTSGGPTNCPAVLVQGSTPATWAVFTVTGSGSNTLTGCTYLAGTAGFTLATNDLCLQNLTPLLVANQQAAQPSHQATASIGNYAHTLPLGIAGQFTYPTAAAYPTATTLAAIVTNGTLTVNSTVAQNGVSAAPTTGHAWILAAEPSTGALYWHKINWTGGNGTTTWTGITFTHPTGSTANATILGGTFTQGGVAVANSPIATDVYASGAAIPLWFFNVVEGASLTGGSYPQQF